MPLPYPNPFVCFEDLITNHVYSQCTCHRFNDANFIIDFRWCFCPDVFSYWCEGITRSDLKQHDLLLVHCCDKVRYFYFFQYYSIFGGLHSILLIIAGASIIVTVERNRRGRGHVSTPYQGFRTGWGVDQAGVSWHLFWPFWRFSGFFFGYAAAVFLVPFLSIRTVTRTSLQVLLTPDRVPHKHVFAKRWL